VEPKVATKRCTRRRSDRFRWNRFSAPSSHVYLNFIILHVLGRFRWNRFWVPSIRPYVNLIIPRFWVGSVGNECRFRRTGCRLYQDRVIAAPFLPKTWSSFHWRSAGLLRTDLWFRWNRVGLPSELTVGPARPPVKFYILAGFPMK